MRATLLTIGAVLALLAAGCGGDDSKSSKIPSSIDQAKTLGEVTQQPAPAQSEAKGPLAKQPKVAKQSGADPKAVETKDLITGKGKKAGPDSSVSVQYVGVLRKNGKQFDASWDRGQSFDFTLGGGEVIPGWDKGIPGMRVGGRRQLTIPAKDAYGAQGQPPTIPPNSALVFVVDLLKTD